MSSKVLIPELFQTVVGFLKKSIKVWNKSFPWHLADLHSFSHNFEALLLFCSARSNFRALSTYVASLWLYMKPFWWLSLVGLLHVLEVMILSSENYTLNLNLVTSIMGVENILMTRSSLLTPPENVWDVPITLAGRISRLCLNALIHLMPWGSGEMGVFFE